MTLRYAVFVFAAVAAAMVSGHARAQVASGTVTITPAAGAYTAAFCLGGVQAVPNLITIGHDGGTILTGTTIVDNTGTNAAVDLVVFNALPTGTYTDHAACTIAAADQPKIAGFVQNTTFSAMTDSAGTTGIETATPALPVTVQGPGGGKPIVSTLWILPIMRGTPTYGAAKTLTLTVFALPD